MLPILACTDGSTYAPGVYQHAAWAASRLSTGVEVLHVIDHHRERNSRHDLTGAIGIDASAELTEELTRLEEAQGRVARLKGKAILDEAASQLHAAGVKDVTTTQRHGTVVETLAAMESGAELVVVGKSGEHAVLAEGQVGGHLEELVRLSVRPVLVAERQFRPVARYVIAFDNSPSASKAVEFVSRSPLLANLHGQLLMVGRADAAHESALNAASELLDAAGRNVSAQLLPGRPAPVIADTIKSSGADLLVMGAYGHSQIREFFVGSTTTRLVRTCPVPVLMIR